MGLIVRLKEDKYVEWSTICDAPVSRIMNEEELKDFMYREELAKEVRVGMSEREQDLVEKLVSLRTEERWQRIKSTGTSSLHGTTAEQVINGNRAGEKETELSVDELIKEYS